MGAWGAATFDNDTACDWAGGLEKVTDLSLVKKALAQVASVDEKESLGADSAEVALAACELLARLQGHWGPRNPYTETVDEWVEAHPLQVPPGLIQHALTVIDRILQPTSELLELWEEAEDGEWHLAVADLRARVQS